MQKLSNYTHAKYCSDETDLLAGLVEISGAMEYRRLMNKNAPNYYYIRKMKLEEKLKVVINKGLRADEFRYRGHIFKAERQFKPHEDFGYVGKRLTRVTIEGWNWDEFYICVRAVGYENISLKNADIFLLDRDFFVVPCENFLGKYIIE